MNLPLNRYPTWKYILIGLVILVAVVYALPNCFKDDPAIQITGANAGSHIEGSTLKQALSALENAGLTVKGSEYETTTAILRFHDSDNQMQAQSVLQQLLSPKYLVALHLAPTTPSWLRIFGARPMKLGLDLRGGVHFLLEVDLDKVLKQRYTSLAAELKTTLRNEKIRYQRIQSKEQQGVVLNFLQEQQQQQALELIKNQFSNWHVKASNAGEVYQIKLSMTKAFSDSVADFAISQNLTTLRNRVDELGVTEAVIQRQGAQRIVVELPGIQDSATAKRIIGRTASLEFRLVAAQSERSFSANSEQFNYKGELQPPVNLKRDVIVTGEQVLDAKPSYDEQGLPQVNITLDSKGGQRMFRTTKNNVGNQMAVLFVEHKSRIKTINDDEVITEQYVEKYVINVATIQSAFSNRFRITGLDSPAESSELALLLRAGALAAPMYFVEERTLGPSLGKENIHAGLLSLCVGFIAVMFFMLFYYRWFGLFANCALLANLVLVVAIMSLLPGAVLTFPGMAGIVLTVGMAVDANVLIFARIREEAKSQPIQAAINAGYERAFITIMDANITTLIVAVILFAAGNGPVKGFAITLSIGILTSMFTAILGTKALVNLFFGQKTLTKLPL